MIPKERVLTALARRQPDRVPIDYSANSGIDRRLKDHFGLEADDSEGLLRVLGVDFRIVAAAYKGPRLHPDVPERGIKVDAWGIHRRWVDHETGGYWDYCEWPLRQASVQEVEAWPMPDPDDFDYSGIRQACERYQDYCVVCGGAGWPDVINACGMVRTMEQVLVDLITDDEAGLRLVERRNEILVEVARRTLEAAYGGVDLMCLGEDLGTQRGPTISLELFGKQIKPRIQQFVDVADSFGIPTMIHSCGSSSWAFEDLIGMGIAAVDTLQPEAKDMAPAYLKKKFGDRLAFHGCISTAGPLARGTVADTVACCRDTLKVMMPGGGYCFAPTHLIQDNTPPENVVAAYEVAREAGRYR
jgi:uroporphyrinogen decarboxylase